MATNLAINDTLMSTALALSGLKTKRETVNMALQEFIQRRKIEDIIEEFGNIRYDHNYNYKKTRSR